MCALLFAEPVGRSSGPEAADRVRDAQKITGNQHSALIQPVLTLPAELRSDGSDVSVFDAGRAATVLQTACICS